MSLSPKALLTAYASCSAAMKASFPFDVPSVCFDPDPRFFVEGRVGAF